MKLKLQEIRKRAGFSSADSFADYMNMSRSTYKNYEQGTRKLTLERAWDFADALNCTLDELAGRTPPVASMPQMSPVEARLLDAFDMCDEREQESVLNMVELFARNEHEKRHPDFSRSVRRGIEQGIKHAIDGEMVS